MDESTDQNKLTTFGKNLKFLRTQKGISQEEFAKRLGVSSRTVQNWECGKKIPDSKREILAKIAGQTPSMLKPQSY